MPRPKGSKNKPKDANGNRLLSTTPLANTSYASTTSFEYGVYAADFDSLPMASTSLKASSLQINATATTTSTTVRQNPRKKQQQNHLHPTTTPNRNNNNTIVNHSYYHQPEKSIEELKEEHERMMRESMLKLKQGWEEICRKYGRDFDDEADEIDLHTGEITLDNGHLRNMKDDTQGNYDVDNWLVNTDSEDEDEGKGGKRAEQSGSGTSSSSAGSNNAALTTPEDEALEVDEDEGELQEEEVLSSLQRVQEVLGRASGSAAPPPPLSLVERKDLVKRPASPTTPDSLTLEHDVAPVIAAEKDSQPVETEKMEEKGQAPSATVIDTNVALSFRSPEISPIEASVPVRESEAPVPQVEEVEKPITLPTTPPAEIETIEVEMEVDEIVEKNLEEDAEKDTGNSVENDSGENAQEDLEKSVSITPPPSDSPEGPGEITPHETSPTPQPEIVPPDPPVPPSEPVAEPEKPPQELVQEPEPSEEPILPNEPDILENPEEPEEPTWPEDSEIAEESEGLVPMTPTTATAAALSAVSISPKASFNEAQGGNSSKSVRKTKKRVKEEMRPKSPIPSSESAPSTKLLKGKEKAAQESPDDDIWKISEDDPFFDPEWNDRHPDGEPPAHMFPPRPKPYVSVPQTPTPRSTPRRTSYGSLSKSKRKASASKRKSPPPMQIVTPRSGKYLELMKSRLSVKRNNTPGSGEVDSSPLRHVASTVVESDDEDDLSFLLDPSRSIDQGTKRKRQSLGDSTNQNDTSSARAGASLANGDSDVRTPKSVKLSSKPAKCGTPGYRCPKAFCFTCID